jgi:hypothetical protein
MKTASIQHLDNLVNNSYTTYHIDFSTLTNIYTYIMKKLTNVSPFLLLLVPVFMMMILTVVNNAGNAEENMAKIKSSQTSIANLPASTLK